MQSFNTFPDPWDLRYFQEVAATENLSRAAERLGIGQPALSQSLKRLEEQLEVELFLRRSRGLTLTEAGTRLLKACNVLLADWEAVRAETRKSQSELSGRYSLGCHPSVALYTLDPLVERLYGLYPALELRLVHGPSMVICERVISGQLDFGFVVNPIQHDDLVIHHLADDQVGFWRTPQALKGVLLLNPGLQQSQSLVKKIDRELFDRTLTSDSLEVLAILARSGAGTAILPERVVRALAPELKRLPKMPTYKDQIAFVYRVDLPKTASAKALITTAKELKI